MFPVPRRAKPRCLNSRHCLVLKVRHFQQWMVRPGWQNGKHNLNMKHLPTVPKEDLEPNSKVRNNDDYLFLVYIFFLVLGLRSHHPKNILSYSGRFVILPGFSPFKISLPKRYAQTPQVAKGQTTQDAPAAMCTVTGFPILKGSLTNVWVEKNGCFQK